MNNVGNFSTWVIGAINGASKNTDHELPNYIIYSSAGITTAINIAKYAIDVPKATPSAVKLGVFLIGLPLASVATGVIFGLGHLVGHALQTSTLRKN
jgi:hypothetical protein